MDKLLDVLAKHNIRAPVEWNAGITRDGAQWFAGKKWIFKDKEYYQAWYGDYKTGLYETWKSHESYTAAEKKEAEAQIADTLKLEREAREKAQKEIAHEQCDLWEQDSDTGRTPYMDRKQIKELYGARIRKNAHGEPILIVPLWDVEGKLWNVQRIYSQKLSHGDKFFTEGARIDGLFHILGDEGIAQLKEAKTIFICEGFATAASIKEALGDAAVVSAFNSGNMPKVALELASKYPKAKLILCADNDSHNTPNTGLEAAIDAAARVGGTYVAPVFRGERYKHGKFTDFNDLFWGEGAEVVRDQILHPDKYQVEVTRIVPEIDKLGKIKKPTEQKLVDHLLKYLDGKLIKQDDTLFQYKDAYWQECEQREIDQLKRMVQVAAGGKLANKDIENTFRLLKTYVDHPKGLRNMYQPNPMAANFTNGTLYLVPGGELKWSPAHNRYDYLTHVLPFDCPDINSEPTPAPMFDQWLKRMWQGDADRETKIRFYHQLMGACLCPAYPLINIFTGPPNSGKSTLVKMLIKLVNPLNTSRVQLSNMDGFWLESMINKTVNFGTEMELKKPIADVNVKAIIDRDKYNVNRKGKKIIEAHLPALHIFAANDVPTSLDGASRAFERRVVICRTEKLKLESGEGQYDYESKLWEAERQGIIGRALKALRELHQAGGQYIRPESSAEHVVDMQLRSDIVGQFIEDAKVNEADGLAATAVVDPGRWIKRVDLWDIFCGWRKERAAPYQHVSNRNFYARIESLGFTLSKQEGYWGFWGIGSIVKIGGRAQPTALQGTGGAEIPIG